MNKTKQQAVIEATSTKHGLNRFEAQRIGDSCLNSTISNLTKKGYQFRTERETVPNRFGGQTHCNRYWLISKPQHKGLDAVQVGLIQCEPKCEPKCGPLPHYITD